MRKIIEGGLVCLFFGFGHFTGFGQGQLNFFTFNPDASKGRIIFSGGSDGGTLGGLGQLGQVLAGTTPDDLKPIGVPVEFLLGGGQPSGILRGGILTVDGVPGGSSYFVAVAAWDSIWGNTYEEAILRRLICNSETLLVTLGGPSSDGGPPLPPPQINQFSNFDGYYCPEPASVTLLLISGFCLIAYLKRGC